MLTLQTTTSNLQYRFELLGGAPAGMSLDAATGVLTWTPVGMQGRTTNVVGVRVVDAAGSADTRTFTVAVTWPANVPGGEQWKFQAGGAISACPAIDAQGTVYFGAEDKKVYAVNGVTGEKKWEFETGGAVSAAPAVSVNGLVYVGSGDGKLYALETGTGRERWEFSTTQPVKSTPAIGPDGTVYFGADVNKVYALKGDSGVKQWEFQMLGEVASSPIIGADGALYVGEGSSVVAIRALDRLAGLPIWKTIVWTNIFAGCFGPAIGSNGLLYFGAPFELYAIEHETGVVKFASGPPADEGIPHDNNFTSAIWSHYYAVQDWVWGRRWYLSPVIGRDNTLYCGMHNQTLWAMDAATGAKKWSLALGDYLASAPAVGSDGTVYAGTMAGTLYALDGVTGTELWKFPVGGIPSSVAIGASGTLYVGSTNGILYAITGNAPGGLADSPWPKYQGNGRNTGSVLPEILNQPPVLTMPPTQVIDEQTPLTLTLVATDPDVPTNTLTYGLISAPQGVNLDAATGVLAWTPTELQGPGTYLISIGVTDNGIPALSATNSFTVVVNEVNRAPVLTTAVRDFRVAAGATLVFTNTATDADIPTNTLVFLLDLDAPAGAQLDRNTGVFVWTVPNSAATNRFHIWVTDDGAHYLRDSQSFTIVTLAAPRPLQFQSIRKDSSGGLELVWSGSSGTACQLQSKARLDDSPWLDVAGTPTASAESVTFSISVSTNAQRFYRVIQQGD